MKSARLFFYHQSEWLFRKNHRVLSRMRRTVEKIVRDERQNRVRELDEEIERLKAEKLPDELQAGYTEEEQDSLLEDEPKFDERNDKIQDYREPDIHEMDGLDDFNEIPF